MQGTGVQTVAANAAFQRVAAGVVGPPAVGTTPQGSSTVGVSSGVGVVPGQTVAGPGLLAFLIVRAGLCRARGLCCIDASGTNFRTAPNSIFENIMNYVQKDFQNVYK